MTRTSKIFIYICVAGLAALYACSDKETPQPVVDTARMDELRSELRSLRSEVLGLQADFSQDSLSEKELEAEIKKLNSVFAKTVDYSVIVTDLQGNNLADADVKLTQAGVIKTVKTNANGVAIFPALRGGYITASVGLTGFSTLVYVADITDYNTNQAYSGNSHVSLIPVGGTTASDKGMFTVKLDLFANYTVVDDTLGGPAYWGAQSNINFALPVGPDGGTTSYSKVTDKKVIITLNQSNFSGINSTLFTTSGGAGQVISTAFENTTIVATAAAADGTYAIKVPAQNAANFGFDFYINYAEFSANFTDYVPGGTGVRIDPPFSPTVTASKVWRLDYDNYSAQNPGTSLAIKRFYYYSNN